MLQAESCTCVDINTFLTVSLSHVDTSITVPLAQAAAVCALHQQQPSAERDIRAIALATLSSLPPEALRRFSVCPGKGKEVLGARSLASGFMREESAVRAAAVKLEYVLDRHDHQEEARSRSFQNR